MIVAPVARKVPTIIDSVTTVSTPGDSIDVIITDCGVAINPKQTPKREKLEKRLRKAKLNIRPIEELKEEAYNLVSPIEANLTSKITAMVEYRDGTYLDAIYRIAD